MVVFRLLMLDVLYVLIQNNRVKAVKCGIIKLIPDKINEDYYKSPLMKLFYHSPQKLAEIREIPSASLL